MKGHIRERSPGRWAIVIDVRDDTGKRRRRWHSFRGTKRQAQIECSRLITEAQSGAFVDPGRVTVAEHLDRWLEHVQTQVSPGSHRTYRIMLQSYVVPALGTVRLNKLTSLHLASFYARAMQTGYRRRKDVGLSARSVRLIHRILSQALKQAVRWKLLVLNPADAAEAPRLEEKPVEPLSIDATLALIEASRSTEVFPVVLLAAMTGMRRGELAALRWSAVNLDAGTLEVKLSVEEIGRSAREKPTKSGRGRTIALSAIVVEELRRHRLYQAEQLLRLGVRQTESTHVCARGDGMAWLPSDLFKAFAAMLKANGLPRMRLHDLRHTHASQLLKEKVHPKVVQERLGHASISMTLDLYSHVMPGIQAEAAATLDAVMRDAMQRRMVAKR